MKNEPFYPDDELDGLLRSSLGEFSPEAPERLWTGIEARLPERRRRPLLLWWWVAFGLTVFSTGAAYLLPGKKHPETNVTASVGRDSTPKLAAAGSPNEAVSTYSATRHELKRPDERENIRRLPGQKSSKTASNENFAVNTAGMDMVSEKPGRNNFDSQRAAHSPLPHRILKIAAEAPILSITPTGPLFFDAGAESQAGVEAGIKPGKTSANRYHIGLFAGPVWEWTSGSPHAAHGAITVQVSNPASGWQTGIYAGFDLNPRWRVQTGLWRQTFIENVSHHATLQLRDGVLIPPATYTDPKAYQFEYALLTGGSTTNVRVRIAEEDLNTTMPDDEPFTLAMQTTHRRTDWLVPLSIQRRFGRGRWQGGLQTGVVLTIPGTRNVQVDHFTEHCADLCYAVGHTPEFVVQDPGKTSLSWQAGVELEYHFATRWKLALNPVFFGQNTRKILAVNAMVQYTF